MKRKGISMTAAVFLTAVFLTTVFTAAATDLKLGINGSKNFELNEEVGPASLKFFSKAPMEDIEGSVNQKDIKSSIKLNASNIEASTGIITFQVSGMKTGINTRDEHLYSETWLDGGQYPEISYGLTGIKDVKITSSGDGKTVLTGTAIGDFNMHGKSKSVSAPIKITYLKESEATKKKASGDLFFVEGVLVVELADYDVKGKPGIVGSKVGESIHTAFQLFYSESK